MKIDGLSLRSTAFLQSADVLHSQHLFYLSRRLAWVAGSNIRLRRLRFERESWRVVEKRTLTKTPR